jgi:hypothetical protein
VRRDDRVRSAGGDEVVSRMEATVHRSWEEIRGDSAGCGQGKGVARLATQYLKPVAEPSCGGSFTESFECRLLEPRTAYHHSSLIQPFTGPDKSCAR